MTWLRLDDLFPRHRKVRRLSDAAFRVHVEAKCWASHHLTDGHIPADELDDVTTVRRPARYVAELVTRGLWHEAGHECASEHCRPIPDGWLVHDFLDYNPTAVQVKAERASARRRQELYRDRDLVDAVKRRDRNLCRYCGQLVAWKDRRGGRGGTLDYVDPTGPNALSNLVVACRSCNSRKAGRTPQAAGMPLLPVPGFSSRSSSELDPSRIDTSNATGTFLAPYPYPSPSSYYVPPVSHVTDARGAEQGGTFDEPPPAVLASLRRSGKPTDAEAWRGSACTRVVLLAADQLADGLDLAERTQDAWDRLAVLAALDDTRGPGRLLEPAAWERAGHEAERMRIDAANRAAQLEEREARNRGAVACEHGALRRSACALCRKGILEPEEAAG